jgi:hypothetical protein
MAATAVVDQEIRFFEDVVVRTWVERTGQTTGRAAARYRASPPQVFAKRDGQYIVATIPTP